MKSQRDVPSFHWNTKYFCYSCVDTWDRRSYLSNLWIGGIVSWRFGYLFIPGLMHVKVKIFSTEIISIQHCTILRLVLNSNVKLYHCTWDCDRITSKPDVWLLTADNAARVHWDSNYVWCFLPLFRNKNIWWSMLSRNEVISIWSFLQQRFVVYMNYRHQPLLAIYQTQNLGLCDILYYIFSWRI